MRCQACGKENPPSSLFCQQCGARLVMEPPAMEPPAGRACPRCGATVPAGVRFCTECGQALAASPPDLGETPPSANSAVGGWRPAPSPPPGGVPKTVVTAAAHTEVLAARLVAILKDGSDGRIYPLGEEQTDVGREEGDVVLRDDPYLSPRHARIRRRGDTFHLKDLDSANGIYVRIRQPVDLNDGDMILIGQEVLRFETLPEGELPLGPATVHGVLLFGTPEVPRIARLVQYTTEGVGRDVYYLYRDETVLGRENGDIVFTDDPFLSRRHASIALDRAGPRYVLRDLGSSNGTAVRLRAEHTLIDGDQFRMGRHLFRFDRVGTPGGRPVAR